MSDIEHENADVMFPAVNKASSDPRGARARTANISIGTSSAAIDISTYFTRWDQGHFYTMLADGGDVYFFFSDVNTDTAAIAATGAGGVTVCAKLPNGSRWDGRIPDGYKYLTAIGSVACTLRMSIASRRPGQSLAAGDL